MRHTVNEENKTVLGFEKNNKIVYLFATKNQDKLQHFISIIKIN